MKTNYIFLFAGLLLSQATKAQTLTKSANEPAVGDIHTLTNYDSVGVIPKNTGANQTWNFSAFTEDLSSTTSSTFVSVASVPFASNFPGATIVEDQGSGDYMFYKSSSTPTTQFELLGSGSSLSPSVAVNFTNSAVQNVWPMSYNSSYTDAFSGKLSGAGTGNYLGSATVVASGNGTITMPGGKTYANILQVRTVRKLSLSVTAPFPFSFTTTETQYDYYEPSQKFPLVSVLVGLNDDGSTLDTSISVTANKIITVGITDRNFEADYAIYPNPAKDQFHVKLTNNSAEACSIEVFTATGQLAKVVELGNSYQIEGTVSIGDLSPGIYLVKTSLGEKSSVRRLIVE